MVARRLVAFALVLLAGCDASTSLLVDVKTDLVPAEEFARVRTVVRPSGSDRVLREQERASSSGDDFVAGVRAAELDGLEPGNYLVRVELSDVEGRPVMQRSVLVALSRSTAVTVVLTRSCRGVSCPSDAYQPGATECLGGRCVPPECVDLDDCGASECASATDCTSLASCASPVCDEGVCLAREIDGACPVGRYCDPETGCRPSSAGDEDAGAPAPDAGCGGDADCDDGVACTTDRCDAGACTSTPDHAACTEGSGGECVAGFGCQYDGCTPSTCEAGPCETARCDGATCVIEPTCDAATEQCCGGACVPTGCDDGNPCTDDTCGAAGCEHVGNTDPCDDGVFCNGADTCSGGSCGAHAGDPCGGSSVCDETADRCVGCVTGSDCPPTAYGAWSSCSYGTTCAEAGTRQRDVTTYACVASTCAPSTTSESGTCTRDTDGTGCGTTTYSAWGSCGGYSSTCDETGTRSRTRTDYACAGGGCTSSPTVEMGSCARDTDGTSCGTTTYTAWSACGGFTSPCDETGTESRTRTDYACGAGGCVPTDTVETRGCARDTDGATCATTSYTAWSTCSGFAGTCDETGTQSRTRTDYACSSGSCGSSDTPESRGCTRNTDGSSCEDWSRCSTGSCSSGSCVGSGSPCSGRCCEPNICVCNTCACP